MSDEHRALLEKERQLNEELEEVRKRLREFEEMERKIDLLVHCPQCKNTDWYIYANYDPFNKQAYESRKLKLVCKDCGYTKIEDVVTEAH